MRVWRRVWVMSSEMPVLASQKNIRIAATALGSQDQERGRAGVGGANDGDESCGTGSERISGTAARSMVRKSHHKFAIGSRS